MIYDEDDGPISEALAKLAELAEQMTKRLESSNRLPDENGLNANPASVAPIRELSPTLQALILTGEEMSRHQGFLAGLRRKNKGQRT